MEARTAFKMTPLQVAVFYGSAAVVKMLLEHERGVAIDALDFGSCEPPMLDEHPLADAL